VSKRASDGIADPRCLGHGGSQAHGLHLDDESVEAVAQRVAELLRETPPPRLMGVAEVAQRFGLSKTYVYEHADSLGAIRIGDGPRPRLRFDLDVVAQRLTSCSVSSSTESRGTAGRAKPRRRTGANGQNGAGLLPITPQRGAR